MSTHRTAALLLFGLASSACSDTANPDEIDQQEVITTVVLSFSPVTGGQALEFRWADPEYDGSPVIDDVVLPDAHEYELTVAFLNELEIPVEDITDEIERESDEHQVFFTGTAVSGPATGDEGALLLHEYADADSHGFPVGLKNTVQTQSVGVDSLTVTLRHLPAQGDTAVKTGGLADDVAMGGFEALPGDTDAQVSFRLTVQ